MPPAQDHKRLQDGDLGPNTGGMGAYCPTPQELTWHFTDNREGICVFDGTKRLHSILFHLHPVQVSQELLQQIKDIVLQKTVDRMKEEGTPFVGEWSFLSTFLFFGVSSSKKKKGDSS